MAKNGFDEKELRTKYFAFLVGNLGFPIAVAGYLLWEIKPILAKINENLIRLTYVIESLSSKVN